MLKRKDSLRETIEDIEKKVLKLYNTIKSVLIKIH